MDRILLICPELNGTSQGGLVVETAEDVRRAEGLPIIWTSGGALLESARRGGLEVRELALPKPSFVEGRRIRSLARQIRRQDSELIHAFELESAPLCARLAALSGRPWVLELLDEAALSSAPRIDPRLLRGVLVPSEELRARLAHDFRVPKSMLSVVPAPSLSTLTPVPTRARGESLVVGSFGPIREESLHICLVRALIHAPQCLAVIIGGGEGSSRLWRQAQESGVGDRLVLREDYPDRGALFELFDVYFDGASSSAQSFDMTEAAARGVPIVSGRRGELLDSLVREKRALQIPAGDPRALAEAVAQLASAEGEVKRGAAPTANQPARSEALQRIYARAIEFS